MFVHSCIGLRFLKSVHNSYKRDTVGNLRLPIVPEDQTSPGTLLHRFIFAKMSPGQTRFHCQPATLAQRNAFVGLGRPEALYSPSQPLGRNTITNLFTQAGIRLEMAAPLKGHALRRMAITKMASGGVQISEIMATARHGSVSATLSYMQNTNASGVAKLQSLGLALPKPK